MGMRLGMTVNVADLAAALQDDPSALVDLLHLLAAADAVANGALSLRIASHAPDRRHASMSAFLGRLGRVFGLEERV